MTSKMIPTAHRFLVAVAAAALLPAAAAQAQYYSTVQQPAPLYPYAVPGNQPYAVQVAPNTYVIRRPARSYPYVNRNTETAEPKAPAFDRPHKKADRALIEELRKRTVKRTIVNTKRIVRDPPVVIETKRIVDDPPRVIERRHIVEDAPRAPAAVDDIDVKKKRGARDDGKKRVIQADAEVTILGPDRMSIRLFRKGQGPGARAEQN